MRNLRHSIDLLFRRISPDDILSRAMNSLDLKKKPLSDKIDEKLFSDLALPQLSDRHNNDEIDMLYGILNEKAERCKNELLNTGQSVFNLLLHFAKHTLIDKDGEPLCKYNELLSWHELSRKLGENIFTTIYLAYQDIISRNQRLFFAWPPIIRNTNTRLQQLLDKGLAENHFHLKGSAPCFTLSWISLMNRITKRGEEIKKFQKGSRLEPEIISNFTGKIPELYTLIKKAAYIRAFLFTILNSYPMNGTILAPDRICLIKPGDENEFLIYTQEIQEQIGLLKYQFGKRFNSKVPDYAIPQNILPSNMNGNALLYGERYFLYSVFKELFKPNNEIHKYRELFYTYLVIKEKLRQEFVQVNDRVGFSNFRIYQDRKDCFIGKNTIYEKALYYMAVQTSMKNQNIVSFETRIAPNNLRKSIKAIDKFLKPGLFDIPGYSSLDKYLKPSIADNTAINDYLIRTIPFNQYAHTYFTPYENYLKLIDSKLFQPKIEDIQFYTVHFIKRKPEPISKIKALCISPRDWHRRTQIKKEAHSIANLRTSLSPSASRIRGIDAASSEIGCRPEVFAQAFRFLKCHHLNQQYELFKEKGENVIKKLGATYHAGEDFLDIIDGLRAIDETVRFLNLCHGDRIGHALALGIDPFDYYELKQYRIILSKQDLLDNIAWMLSQILKYARNDFSQLSFSLEKQYNRLFSEIYLNTENNNQKPNTTPNSSNTSVKFPKIEFICPFSTYYDAWELRGDDPMLYAERYYKPSHNLTPWDHYAANDYSRHITELRKNTHIAGLYYHYHFNNESREKGNQKEEFPITNQYSKAVQLIQQEMQKEIRDLGIGIETNPSSNVLIGTFRRYSKHPIINFFNLGLTADPEKLNRNPQMFVSINTDDQGVFNTCLEREYALMALALEKEEDRDGNKIYNPAMIYDWLDRIRQMGIEQSFK